jgi:hypothetical protein
MTPYLSFVISVTVWKHGDFVYMQSVRVCLICTHEMNETEFKAPLRVLLT